MSLISEINRTETEKNKTKTVATNIDNKLVELGGEQAIDLSDVPNKMEVMVKENYKKIAILNKKISSTRACEQTAIAVPVNLTFKPSRVLAHFPHTEYNDINDGSHEFTDSASESPDHNTAISYDFFSGQSNSITIRIKSWTASKITFEVWSKYRFEHPYLEIICIE